jgi:colanic acid/amylovoran biosynthesis protein
MITLLNAAPDTGNQGVSALCHSAVAGLARRGIGPVNVADHGRGLRDADWGYAGVRLVGLTHHRRFWRGDSLRTAHALVRLGGGPSPAARTSRARAPCSTSRAGTASPTSTGRSGSGRWS